MRIERTGNTHPDFIQLIQRLDADLRGRYGEQQAKFDPHNQIDPIETAIVGYIASRPAACGCFKTIDDQTIEIKRMYVGEEYRRRGLSVLVLAALEKWGAELGFSRAILETGDRQIEAIGLYTRCGYHIIDNYGPYVDFEKSICYEKLIG